MRDLLLQKRLIRAGLGMLFLLLVMIPKTSPAQSAGSDTTEFRGLDQDIEQVYLAFVQPYPAYPTTIFGNVFLLVDPVDNTTPVAEWPSIGFSAITSDSSEISVAWKRLRGRIAGRYTVKPFTQRLQEIAKASNRDLWLFPVALSDSQLERFRTYINGQIENHMDFGIAANNGPTRMLQLLLYTVNRQQSLGMTSPQRMVEYPDLASYLKDPIYIPSLEDQARQARTSKQPLTDLSQLLTTASWFKEDRVWKDANYQKEVQRVAQHRTPATDLSLWEPAEFAMHGPIQGQAGVRHHSTMGDFITLSLRMGLHDITDRYDTYPQHQYLRFLEGQFLFAQNQFLVDHYWLIRQSNRRFKSPLDNPATWDIGIGGRRYFIADHSHSDMAHGVYGSFGRSFGVINDTWYTSLMIGAHLSYLEEFGLGVILDPQWEQRLFFGEDFNMRLTLSNPIVGSNEQLFNPTLESTLTYRISPNLSFTADFSGSTEYYRVDGGLQYNLPNFY
jgi:hypothetical protein